MCWTRTGIANEEISADVLSTCGHNTVACTLSRASGFHLEKHITLDANNTSDTKNLFQFVKNIRVLVMHFEVTAVTTMTNCTNLYFDVWDGSTATALTLDGATISGYEVGSFGLKDQTAASALTVARADQARLTEPAANKKSHQPFILTAKSGQSDYIRLNYTTTDTPINAELLVVLEYSPINGGYVAAV